MKNTSFSKEILAVKAAVFVVVVIGLVVLASVYLYTRGGDPVVTAPPVVQATTTVSDVSSTTPSEDLYQGISDSQFVTFAHDVIEKRCPFYEPNGAVYHGCISDWVTQVEASSPIEAVDEVHAFCEKFASSYNGKISFKQDELFVKCVIWKLLQ